MTKALFISILLSGFAVVAIGASKQSTAIPTFDASAFAQPRENPYFPLRPGSRYSYRSQTPDGIETTEVEVTHQTKTILGVRTTVVHDRAFLDGELEEDTFDWFATDHDGNVWYFGEDSREIEDGQVISTEGSWEAGKNNAQPGIIMLGNPKVGLQYRQEFAPGIAEDTGEVLSVNETVTVPLSVALAAPSVNAKVRGTSRLLPSIRLQNCVKTRDRNPFEADVVESKFYAPGIGLVLEVERDEEGERTTNRLVHLFIPESQEGRKKKRIN